MNTSRSVAVIVASYNHAEFLAQRMQSIIDQSHQDLEVLVIDDFSTDNSRDVLDQFKSDPRIQFVYSDVNRGWVATSNLGVELTSAEFVLFANCDDFCIHAIHGEFSIKPSLRKVSKYENKFAKLQKKAAEFNFRNQLKQVKKKEFTMEDEDKEVSGYSKLRKKISK